MFVTNIFSLPGDGALCPGTAGGGVAGVWLDHTLLVLGEDGVNEEMYCIVLYCIVLYCTVLYLADVTALAVWVPHTLGLAPGDGVGVGDEAGLNKYF